MMIMNNTTMLVRKGGYICSAIRIHINNLIGRILTDSEWRRISKIAINESNRIRKMSKTDFCLIYKVNEEYMFAEDEALKAEEKARRKAKRLESLQNKQIKITKMPIKGI